MATRKTPAKKVAKKIPKKFTRDQRREKAAIAKLKGK